MILSETIVEDKTLLKIMLLDQNIANPIFQPGEYWSTKTKNSTKRILNSPLNLFRSSDSLIGLSYADNLALDVSRMISPGWKTQLLRQMRRIPPIGYVVDKQVALTRWYYEEMMAVKQFVIANNPNVHQLLENWEMPFSLQGGAEAYYEIDGKQVSEIYLNMLSRHQIYAGIVDFKSARTFCEIGGGFGANVHLILSNYENIRKVIYIDVAPNLYVATQYLKSFFGDSVLDYQKVKAVGEFNFANNDELEILCIAPWQMDQISVELDIFQNDCSFVEMPVSVIQKYQQILQTWDVKNNCSMLIGSYLPFDPKTTLDPKSLPGLFPLKRFHQFIRPVLCSPDSEYLYQISSNSLQTEP
jgi:putative sugar O-methyltransferase